MTLQEILADPTITAVRPPAGHPLYRLLYVNPDRTGLEIRDGAELGTKCVSYPVNIGPYKDRTDWAVHERVINGMCLRFDGQEVLSHEVGNEMVWICPVTGTCFHMERMADNHFWFRLDIRTKPMEEGTSLQCGVYQPKQGRLQLLVEQD